MDSGALAAIPWMPYTFPLKFVITIGAECDYLEVSDAARMASADIQTFCNVGVFRDHLWPCSRCETCHALRVWSGIHNPWEPLWIWQAFMDFEFGESEYYEEFVQEYPEVELVENDWSAFIMYRHWTLYHGFLE